MTLCAGVARAQSEPPNRVRVAIEEDVALVRVVQRTTGEAIRHGTALIVHDDGETLTLVTADHVIKAANESANQSVEVRFFGRDLWVTIGESASLGEAGLDLAMLQVDRRRSPFGRARRGATLPVSQTPADQARVWVRGYDRDTGEAAWRTCWVSRSEGDLVLLNGRGIAPGYSGGVVVSQLGPVGMVTERGPGNSNHRAISYLAIAEALSEIGLDHALVRNPANDALQRALDTQLAVAFYVVDYSNITHGYQYWSAMTIDSVDAGRYSGVVYNGERPRQPNHVDLVPGPTNVKASFTIALSWNMNGNGTMPGTELLFEPVSSLLIDGFVVLRADMGDKVCFLAIPTESSELLLARSILQAVPPGGTFADLPPGIGHTVREDIRHRQTVTPFSAVVYDVPTGDRLEFRLPSGLVRDEPVTITGRHLFPDEMRRGRRENVVAAAPQTTVRVETLTDEVLDETVLGEDGGTFTLRLTDVPGDSLRLRFTNEKSIFVNGSRTSISTVIVKYDALRN
jgi:hypothetical protein